MPDIIKYSEFVEDVTTSVIEAGDNNVGNSGRSVMRSLGPKTTLRLLPPKKGERQLYIQMGRHFVPAAAPNTPVRIVECPGQAACPVCRVIAVAEFVGNIDPMINRSATRNGAYWAAVDVGDDPAMELPSTLPGIYWLPWTVHKTIKDQTGISSRDIVDEPWHPVKGFPLTIVRQEGRGPISYSVQPRRNQVKPVPVDILKEIPALSQVVKAVTGGNLHKAALALAIKFNVPKEHTPFLPWNEASSVTQPDTPRLPGGASGPSLRSWEASAPAGRTVDSLHDMTQADFRDLKW